MAKKKEDKVEIKLERVYNVPLRNGYMKTPKYKRAKKAVKTLREFLMKHMKSDNVKIGDYANKKIWKDGIKNPPHHIKVTAKKDSEGVVFAEFVGAPAPKPKKEETKKKETKKETKKEDAKEISETKVSDKPKTEKKETKKESEDVKAALEGKEVKKPEPVKKEEVKKPAPKLSKEESDVKAALTQ